MRINAKLNGGGAWDPIESWHVLSSLKKRLSCQEFRPKPHAQLSSVSTHAAGVDKLERVERSRKVDYEK